MSQLPPLPVRTQRCCAPTSPLDPAIAPAAGTGAAPLRPYSLSPRVSHLSRLNGGASLSSASSNSRAVLIIIISTLTLQVHQVLFLTLSVFPKCKRYSISEV